VNDGGDRLAGVDIVAGLVGAGYLLDLEALDYFRQIRL